MASKVLEAGVKAALNGLTKEQLVSVAEHLKGAKVVGFPGTDDKVAWLKELGFDEAFNYKTVKDLDATLKSVAPNGINCYFDNGIRMQGFVINSHKHRYPEWFQQNVDWIKAGKLKYREHMTQGFHHMVDAYIVLLKGDSTGKAVVQA